MAQAAPSGHHPSSSDAQQRFSNAAVPIVSDASGSSGVNSFVVQGTRFDVPPRYKLIKPLGRGAYGVVCSAIDLATNKKVAIKKITKAFTNVNHTKRTLRELKILRHFQHENILQFVDIIAPTSYESFEDVYLITELLDTDLHQIITSSQPLTEEHIQYFVYQILRGLKYIHTARVLHRDLKPSNLLLNANCELKICDFGLARVALPDQCTGFLTEYVATRWYRAPEIMLSWKEYTRAIDIWSVGCIFGELLGRKPLFPGRDYMSQLHLVLGILGKPSDEDSEYIASPKAKAYIRSLPPKPPVPFNTLFKASPEAIDLLEKMLTFSPEKRITVEEALAHPFLSVLHDPSDEPVSQPFDFYFERCPQTKEALKALLWHEACAVHTELKALPAPPLPKAIYDDFNAAARAQQPAGTTGESEMEQEDLNTESKQDDEDDEYDDDDEDEEDDIVQEPGAGDDGAMDMASPMVEVSMASSLQSTSRSVSQQLSRQNSQSNSQQRGAMGGVTGMTGLNDN